MSRLVQPNGDDYPEAAAKHLVDAAALLGASRYDGAGYLAGYVVECSLKSLIQLERGASAVPMGRKGHDIAYLAHLASQACAAAGARTAKYIVPAVTQLAKQPPQPVAAWTVQLRYQAPRLSFAEADSWLQNARDVYTETLAKMRQDGVI